MLPVATLLCAILAGCTGSTPGANRSATPSPSPSRASSARGFGPPGSAGNPLVLSCDARFGPSLWFRPRPGDLVIGPLDLAGGKAVATMTPAEYGYSNDGHGGRFYKMGLALARGATATVTIAPPVRGHVVMDIGSLSGVTSATYHSCARQAVGFAQGFAFTHRPFRGCVPLDVMIGDRPPVHHVNLSLFAGPCMTDPAA
jgi:hypothetical protein